MGCFWQLLSQKRVKISDKWLPVLNRLSSGFVIIICAVAASAAGAFFYPVLDEEGKEDGK